MGSTKARCRSTMILAKISKTTEFRQEKKNKGHEKGIKSSVLISSKEMHRSKLVGKTISSHNCNIPPSGKKISDFPRFTMISSRQLHGGRYCGGTIISTRIPIKIREKSISSRNLDCSKSTDLQSRLQLQNIQGKKEFKARDLMISSRDIKSINIGKMISSRSCYKDESIKDTKISYETTDVIRENLKILLTSIKCPPNSSSSKNLPNITGKLMTSQLKKQPITKVRPDKPDICMSSSKTQFQQTIDKPYVSKRSIHHPKEFPEFFHMSKRDVRCLKCNNKAGLCAWYHGLNCNCKGKYCSLHCNDN